LWSFDGQWCGRNEFPCATISYGPARLTSPVQGTISNQLKIIGNIEIIFSEVESILLKDLKLTSDSHSIINVKSDASSPAASCVIKYESAVKIENIEFHLGVTESMKKFVSLIGIWK
jgi:hypothetical protein